MPRDPDSKTDAVQDGAFERRWRYRFQERASRFDDEAAIAGWSRSGLQGRFRRFRRLWGARPAGETWLDAGCGAGTYSRFLNEQGLDVVGMDYSAPSLARARERAPQGIAWCAADVRRLPLRDGAVDGALCFGVMQSLAEPDRALAEIVRTLRAGGVIWVDGLNHWCLPNLARHVARRLKGRGEHLRYDRPGDLRARLEKAGVQRLRRHWLPLVPGRLGTLMPILESRAMAFIFRMLPPVAALLSHSFLLVGEKSPTEPNRT